VRLPCTCRWLSLRVVVHDYSGHPFQVQLSRALAERGHTVLHLHCPSYNSGKGALERRATDPAGFSVDAVDLGVPFEKYASARRFAQEISYGCRLVRRIRAFAPEVVLSSNTPLFAQRMLLTACRKAGTTFVFWQQDIYSYGMKSAVAGIPGAGRALGELFVSLERRMLSSSDAVVTISEDFVATLRRWGIEGERVHVIENWAPLEELPAASRRNGWGCEHGLLDKTVFLYSGTLGRKHNPNLILELARRFRHREDIAVVVVSEGVGADVIRDGVTRDGLGNVTLLPFQPYDRLPEVLATGDVLIVLLEQEAGAFAVPSKVLTYQCAGRPLLASMPAENLAARRIAESGSGIVVRSGDETAFVAAAERLAADPRLRERLGQNAQAYAASTFDIAMIAGRFERILRGVVERASME
jgi:colanic acid biosynthesis glycosyl transferase WcaI